MSNKNFKWQIRLIQNVLNDKTMIKEIEQLTDEDLAAIWPAIGGTPHLFEYGKDELKKVLIDGECSDEDGNAIGLSLGYYTMAAIVGILQQRGFATPKFTKDGELTNSHKPK